jgi:hypothetical protein
MKRTAPLVARTPLRARTGLQSSGSWSRTVPLLSPGLAGAEWVDGKSAAAKGTRTTSGRAESFPPAVAALLAARDPWCVHCGSPFNLQNHHRRLKGSGGDPRPHTHCACNGVRLCLLCHVPWAHTAGRREAGAEGIVIPRSETGPWRRPLMVHTAADSGFMAWPTCDGLYVTVKPEGALAA